MLMSSQEHLNKGLIEEFYLLALMDIRDGETIDGLKKAIAYYQAIEDYEACAGIKKAIDEIERETINAIKHKIDDIKNDSRSSRTSNED